MGKAKKGAIQDGLQGLRTPEVAGVFAATGEQSITRSTLGPKPVGSTVPANQVPSSVPGMSASLGAGESPLILPAEAGLDYTKEDRRMAKKAKKAARKAAKKSLLVKCQPDPIKYLSKLEMLAGQLKPQHPARLRAAGVVLKAKLLAREAGASAGDLRKAVTDLGNIGTVAEIAASLQEVEQALGIGNSSRPWGPGQIDARAQLQRIMSGQGSESLAGSQDSKALTAYRSPAAAMGALLKAEDREGLAAAEAELRKAEASGNSTRLSAASERLTYERLKAAHKITGGN